jgi:polyhydroxyalkanoate synthesis regulator phasin
MAEPGSSGERDAVERLVLAAFGALTLSAERLDRWADELTELGGVRRDEARTALEDLASRWRGDATRVTEGASRSLQKLMHELGGATKDDLDELELRVAQLEHRLRLLEGEAPTRIGER